MRGVTERVLNVLEGGVLQPPRKPDKIGFKRLAGLRDRLLKHLSPTTVVERRDYPALYHGRKQGVYQRAYESLLSKAISRKDAYVSTFVKAEKINFTANWNRVAWQRRRRSTPSILHYTQPTGQIRGPIQPRTTSSSDPLLSYTEVTVAGSHAAPDPLWL